MQYNYIVVLWRGMCLGALKVANVEVSGARTASAGLPGWAVSCDTQDQVLTARLDIFANGCNRRRVLTRSQRAFQPRN